MGGWGRKQTVPGAGSAILAERMSHEGWMKIKMFPKSCIMSWGQLQEVAHQVFSPATNNAQSVASKGRLRIFTRISAVSLAEKATAYHAFLQPKG